MSPQFDIPILPHLNLASLSISSILIGIVGTVVLAVVGVLLYGPYKNHTIPYRNLDGTHPVIAAKAGLTD